MVYVPKYDPAMGEIPISSVSYAAYQRKPDAERIRRIAKKFAIDRMRPVDVSYRDGKYWCFDGQHRVEAYKLMGRKTVPAVIHYGLDYEKEAAFLSKMHKNGWKLKEIKGLCSYHFEKCTPEDVVYQLDYNQEGLDIKGIDDEIYQERHSEYFGMFLYSLIRRIESSERNSYLTYLRMMFDMYKHRQLDSGYYREFNAKSQFHYLDGNYANEEYIEDLNAVDISCNLNIILKLMTMLV